MKSLLRSLLLTLVLVSAVYAADQSTRPMDERISVDFPTESRRTIIMNVADHYGLNIAWQVDCPDEPTPMKLRNVTWQDIFDLAFAGSDFTYFTRGNVVWVVRIGDQRQLIGKLRDKLNQEVEEKMRFRDVVAILIKADAPILSEELRGEIQAFLADPNRSAKDLLKKLGKGQPNKRPLAPRVEKAASWVGTPPSPGASTQFICETDKHGRVMRAEVYNFTYRQMIEALAVLTKEKVTIEECPDEIVSLCFQDRSFPEAMHRLLKERGFDMVRGDTGTYRVIRIEKEVPSEGRPNKSLQGTPGKVPSSSSEPEARRP